MGEELMPTLGTPLQPFQEEILRDLIRRDAESLQRWTSFSMPSLRRIRWGIYHKLISKGTFMTTPKQRDATREELAEAIVDIHRRAKLVMEQNAYTPDASGEKLAAQVARWRLAKSTKDYLDKHFVGIARTMLGAPVVTVPNVITGYEDHAGVRYTGGIDRAKNPLWRGISVGSEAWRVKWDDEAQGIAVDKMIIDDPIVGSLSAPNGVAKVVFLKGGKETGVVIYYRTNRGPEIIGRPAMVLVGDTPALVKVVGWEEFNKAGFKPSKWLWSVADRSAKEQLELEALSKPKEMVELEQQLDFHKRKRDKAQKDAHDAEQEYQALRRKRNALYTKHTAK